MGTRHMGLRAVLAVGCVIMTFAACDGSDGPTSCNGHAELCDRPLDEVAFATAHNAMSAASEPNWLFEEHDLGIREQLEFGIRGFQLDTYYGTTTATGLVFSELRPDDRQEFVEEFGEEVVVAADELAAALLVDEKSEPGLYLCHIVCGLGSTNLVEALGWFRGFLDNNPGEVIIIVIEDRVSPEDTAEAFEESGLIKYVYTYEGGPWPTLGEMIENDERVLVMAENDGSGPDWYHPAFELTQETNFSFRSAEEMDCRPNRGRSDSPLFQLNHWISPASREGSKTANEFEFLLNRALKCQEQRGLLPNIVAVNFYRIGDTLAVVDALNGVGEEMME